MKVQRVDMKEAMDAIRRDKALRLFWAYFVVIGLIVWVFAA